MASVRTACNAALTAVRTFPVSAEEISQVGLEAVHAEQHREAPQGGRLLRPQAVVGMIHNVAEVVEYERCGVAGGGAGHLHQRAGMWSTVAGAATFLYKGKNIKVIMHV